MRRILSLLLPLPLIVAGCYTYTQAPGAIGKVVEADTGAPVRGALITRPYIDGSFMPSNPPKWMGVPPEGLPGVTALSDKGGHFDLPPTTRTQGPFEMQLRNPKEISQSFVVSAAGYVPIKLQGSAGSRTRWRVDLGRVLLDRQ
jgi:hypothetical protein